MVETRGTRRTSWKLVSYEWGGGPPRWIKWRDEEGSVTDGVNGVKGTAHASFIRGGHRRDVVSNRVTRGWIEWREGGRNQEEVTKVTSCRRMATRFPDISLIKRIKWVLRCSSFFFHPSRSSWSSWWIESFIPSISYRTILIEIDPIILSNTLILRKK